MVPCAWSGVRPALARPDITLLVAPTPGLTYSLSCAWCIAARSCQIVVAMDVPNEPAVIRTKLDRTDAVGMRSGSMQCQRYVNEPVEQTVFARWGDVQA